MHFSTIYNYIIVYIIGYSAKCIYVYINVSRFFLYIRKYKSVYKRIYKILYKSRYKRIKKAL